MKETNTFKKTLAALIIGCMALCMVACGGIAKSTDSPKTYTISNSTDDEGMIEHAAHGANTLLQLLRQRQDPQRSGR